MAAQRGGGLKMAVENLIEGSPDSGSVFTGERFIPGIEDVKLSMEHYQRYYSVLPLIKGKIVLDAACGEGYGTALMAKSAASVTGVDISEEAVECARRNYRSQGKIDFIKASIVRIPIADHSVDVVISFETIEHVTEEVQWQFLDEICRVLKEDGILIMSTPNKEIYSDRPEYHNKFHIKEFYREDFLSFLRKKFTNVALYDQFFENVCIVNGEEKLQLQETSFYCPGQYSQEAKYYIAIAGNQDISSLELSHVYVNPEHEYDAQISRIRQLQDEVEERNRHIQKLDREIDIYRERIDYLSPMEELTGCLQEDLSREKQCLEETEQRLKETEGEFTSLLGKYNALLKENIHLQEAEKQQESAIEGLRQDIREKDGLLKENECQHQRETQELRQIIRNKEGHIELLLEVEREYEREKKSRTYRLALGFRKLSLRLFPVDSKRRFIARMLGRALRHPIQMLKLVNPRRIKNCITILRTEGGASAQNHFKLVEEYEHSREVPLPENSLSLVNMSTEERDINDYGKLSFPIWDDPEVSIIIPVYNQFEYTYNCLASILKNSGNCKYEIIIGNDCSTDLTCRMEEIIKGIKIINHKENLRFLRNCNNAAQFARGSYILFLNNDTQVQENWLEPLIDLMKKDAGVGMVGSKLIYADGYLQEAGGILWKDASAWNYGNRQNPNDSEFNYVHEADYISGAAVMIRRNLWEEIGGFDERFAPAYCEDSDLAFEVRKHGYKVMYQPKSVVVHFEGVSNGTDLTQGQKKYQMENSNKFYEKWKDVLEKENFENGKEVFLARDRSRNRRHVLVIDHYVPQYDQDAGSKTTFMYLKMLVQKGFHITFLGDNFYQHEPYTTELQQMGILVLYGPKYAEHWKEWLLENISYFDVFYLNRPHITIKYIDIIKEHARGKIIYYGHDLHFLRTRREYELSGDKKHLEESEKWKEQEFYIMRQADMNYYPSALERDEIHKLDERIPVKAITAYVFEEFKNLNYNARSREGLIFVGGFGHGPNLDAVKWFLDKIYPEVYRRTSAPFYIVGSRAPEEIACIQMDGVIFKGFVTEDELHDLYRRCRIAVVPLRYGAGVKGKVIEALYNGIPVITTSVGAEGISGIEKAAAIQDTEEELIQSICSLYVSEEKLTRMSQQGMELVKASFSTEAVWKIVREDFES